MNKGILFTREYLEKLQDEINNNFTIVDYIMKRDNCSFHDAILDLSQYCQLKPEYIYKVKNEKCEDKTI